MIMRNKMHHQFDTSFSGFNTQVEFLRRIPDTSQYFNCSLSHFLNHVFSLTQANQSLQFKKLVRIRILDILGSLKGGAYDLADQSHYLKLFLLLYIHRHNFIQNIEEYSSMNVSNSEESTKE